MPFFPGENHLINLVVVDGKAYITDVSFGVSSQVWEPLELISEKDQPQAAGVFCLTNNGDTWVLEKSCRKPVVMNPDFVKSTLINRKEKYVLYKFTLAPREAEHFEGQNDFLQTNPSSLFTNKSICSLQTPTGFRALVGWTFSEVTYKPEEGVDLIDMRDLPDDEIETVLREKFNVFLTNELKPQNQKACYTI
ncbi:Arylamine N-acetyltransferase, pineal gland isozyme NAT-10 [Oryzias melastigma]|uniref:arylamine N-acetyltransferase n=1 Tax=Oryzias melastigma TaxID=30732 RepID=A0A834CKB2_ORYME|nr:Arylamine N-acetyltransferase, pineal gland isozyme NAT-10 [Oryzias melastigma]